jgi:hypothetical protein
MSRQPSAFREKNEFHPVFAYFFDKRLFFPRSQAPAWATSIKPSDTSTSNNPGNSLLRHSQAVGAACLSPSLRVFKPVNIGKQELSTQVRSQAGAWERERGMPSGNRVRFSRMNKNEMSGLVNVILFYRRTARRARATNFSRQNNSNKQQPTTGDWQLTTIPGGPSSGFR